VHAHDVTARLPGQRCGVIGILNVGSRTPPSMAADAWSRLTPIAFLAGAAFVGALVKGW